MLLLMRLMLFYGLLMLAALTSAFAVFDSTLSPSKFEQPSSAYKPDDLAAAADVSDGTPVEWQAFHITRSKKTAADQRLAELQALFAMSNDGMGYGHGHFDPFAAGRRRRRRRSTQLSLTASSIESPEVTATRLESAPSASTSDDVLVIGRQLLQHSDVSGGDN